MKVRYIRDWANGNTNGTNSNWKEIEAFDINDKNVALNKNVTSPFGSENINRITDGDKNQQTGNDFFIPRQSNGENVYVQVDLGDIYEIKEIKIFRFFPVGNSTTQYNATKTEVSENGTTWVTVFDSATDGKYYETESGKSIKLDILDQNASLEEVMDELEKICLNLSSSTNIISASSLPDSGEEGQMCIITDITPSKYIFSKFRPNNINENEVYICIDGVESQNKFYSRNADSEIQFHILDILQKNNGQEKKMESYLYINSSWVKLTSGALLAYQSGKMYNTDIFGNKFNCIDRSAGGSELVFNDDHLHVYALQNWGYCYYRFFNAIDLTLYTKICMSFSYIESDSATNIKFGVFNGDNKSFLAYKSVFGTGVHSVDITNILGFHFIGFTLDYGSKKDTRAKITKIWLE